MRRSLVAIFAVVFVFTLPARAQAPAPSILGTPVLIVYPFTANGGDITREAGSQLAVVIATQIANLGGVDVRPALPGIDRQEFLAAARRGGADYYVAGYLTPLGDGVSVVEQLVSTPTGIVVYSNTAQIKTLADAAGQGDLLRDALLRHQQRNLGAYTATPPPLAAATPKPAPGTATEATIGRLFGRKQRHTAAASPKPAASPAAALAARPSPVASAASPSPSPAAAALASPVSLPVAASATRGMGIAVLSIGGTAADERRSFAGAALRNDMVARHLPVAGVAATRDAACRTPVVGTLVGGTLTTSKHVILGQAQTVETLDFVASDCAGNVLYRQTFARGADKNWKDAVDGVVATAVASYLHDGPNRRS